MKRRITYQITYVVIRCLLTLRDSPIVALLLGLLTLFVALPAQAEQPTWLVLFLPHDWWASFPLVDPAQGRG